MARAVFDGVQLPADRTIVESSLRVDAAGGEQARVANQRRWLPHASPPAQRALIAAPRRPRRGAAHVVALFERDHLGSTGSLLARQLHALIVRSTETRTRDEWRALSLAVGDGPVAESNELALLEPMRNSVLSRIRAARLRLASPPQLHQAALFDRRAEHAARTRSEVAARLDAVLARRAASLDLDQSRRGRARLIAMWPLR